MFITYYRSSLSPGLASMSMAFAVTMLDALGWTIRMLSELESDSVALERLAEYEGGLEEEAEWDTAKIKGAKELSADWPPDGRIEFEGYSTR